jgi:SAM-dependent methyltransferase
MDERRERTKMLKQIFSLKSFFSWKELLQNAARFRKARGPLRGYATTVALWALMECGCLEALPSGSALSIEAFARERRLDPKLLRSLCRYLNRIGILRLEGEEVSWERRGKKFWEDASGVFQLFHAYEPIFSSLSAQLKKETVFGENLFRRESEVAEGFARLGRGFMFPMMEKILLREKVRSVVDLGCQAAELSGYLCERHPDFRGLGIDHSPAMIDQARERIRALGLDGRLELLQADMFEIDRLNHDFSSYETVTAIDLFHGYFWDGEDRLLSLFRKFKKIFHRQRFLVSEICLPPEKGMRKIAYPYPEHELFHDLTRQKSFAKGELESLWERAGFRIRKRWEMNQIAGRVCLLLEGEA